MEFVLVNYSILLDGYCPREEKFFKEYIKKIIEDYLKFLRDPRLPLTEFREVLASIQGRIQVKLEKEIVRALSNYEQNITSVMAQFPSQKIHNAILDYLSRIDSRERDINELTLEPIMELCSRYRGGVRGHMKMAICDMIKRYTDVEKQFQVNTDMGNLIQTHSAMRIWIRLPKSVLFKPKEYSVKKDARTFKSI